jgi:hypothetical protein
MPATGPNVDKSSIGTPRPQWALLGLALCIFALAGFLLLRNRAPSATVETVEKRPLLKRDTKDFQDAQVGVRFTPPPKWSLQARSTEDSNTAIKDRLLVKFKRLIPGVTPAWLRVYVAKTPPAETIVVSVQNRAPGPGWTASGKAQNTTINGLAGAKISYHGEYNGFPSVRDIIGIRRGEDVIFFIATYRIGDVGAQEQTQQAINSTLLTPAAS